MRMRIFTSTALLSLALFLAPAAPAAALAFGPGDLIKLIDDGNPATDADRAVYYVGADGKRYAFPTEQVFRTWYVDFKTVKSVAAADLAALPLGGNVVNRPGTRLVKITTDPKVYAVEPAGLLRWIATEGVATALYGQDWNKRIDDVADTFFTDYRFGAAIEEPRFPDGSLVKRSADGAFFLISGDTKRRLTVSPTTLGFNPAFVLETTDALTSYPEGGVLGTAESAVTDVAQKSAVTALPETPTWGTFALPVNAVAIGGTSSLYGLKLSSDKPVVLRRVTFKIDATSRTTTTTPAPKTGSLASPTPGPDNDKGGLVYMDAVRPNLSNFRLVDQAGKEVFTRQHLVVDTTLDQSQKIVFSDSLRLDAGESRLWLRAEGNELLTVGEAYRVTLVAAETQLADPETGAVLPFVPTGDIAGPALTAQSGSLTLSPSTQVGRKTYVRGSTGVDLAAVSVKASGLSSAVVTGLTLQGYMDDESDGDFLPGVDLDEGAEARVRDMVTQVWLYDAGGTMLAGPIGLTTEGRAIFSGFARVIAPGAIATFVLRGDLNGGFDLETQPNRLAFDVVTAATDVAVTDDSGVKIEALGDAPNGGVTPSSYVTIKKTGKLTFSWAGASTVAIANRDTDIGTLSLKAEEGSFEVRTLAFIRPDSAEAPPGTVTLKMPVGSGLADRSAEFIGGQVIFSELAIPVDRDKKVELVLTFHAATEFSSLAYGSSLKVQLSAGGPILFVAKSDGEEFTERDFGSSAAALTPNTASALTLRFSDLTVARGNEPPDKSVIYPDTETEVLSFTLHAGPGGSVRVRKLTFKLSPSDVGTSGANNDALEYWADLNGDFEDDNEMASLKLITPDKTKVLIGEGPDARLTYSIVRGGRRSTVSSTLDSKAGDYGILEYLFEEGNEYGIGPGGTLPFKLWLDTSGFDRTSDRTLKVELLGATDLHWTDVPSGTYAPRTDATGAPISVTLTVAK